MVVQHNLRAMNSNRMLGLVSSVQSKSTEKLSSGYKINRAADDAAGLSISEKMRKQIRGLSQASLNAADGISAVQTAEGALNEVQDMLQRMNELAVKAANGTMSEDDRNYIQDEIDQLVTEIDRVSETTKFNESYLLKGVEGTEIVETPASVEVTYKEGITGERQMTWNTTPGTPIWAVKDNKSVQITADNYKDFIELGTKEVVDKVKIASGVTVYNSNGATVTDAQIKTALDADPTTKFYVGANGTNGAGAKATVTANTAGTNTGAVLNMTFSDLSDTVTAALQNELYTAVTNTGFDVSIDGNTDTTLTLAGFNVSDDGKITKAGSDVVLATVAVSGTLQANKTDNAVKLTAGTQATEPGTIADEDDFTVTYKDADSFTAKEGVTIYKTAAAANNAQYGVNVNTDRASEADIASNFTVESDLLSDKDGNTVSFDDLASHFNEDGTYKNTLYKKNTAGNLTEVGADLIGQFVEWTRTEATTEEVTVKKALNFSLQVGADTTEQNKISIDIESMSADSLGIDGLKVDGKDSTNADAAVDVIAEAIQKVSTQRSALGAVQNRLEHTIANLDNVVENTTAAESQIRDTDMATEMVKFSNNNILAQAGQAMLAQANQANQGVLSLLG